MANFQIHSRDGVNWVEIHLNNEMVRAEAGALRYMQGPLEMESKTPGLGGMFKAAMTGESIFRPTYKGSGRLVLEPSINNFFELKLAGESLVLDQGAYLCSDAAIEVSAQRNKMMAGLAGGEGMWQTLVSGHGTVIIAAPGALEVIDLINDRLVVDGTFAVARSSSLNFKVEKAAKSLLGSATSGEGFVNVLEGSGRVWIAPVPNHSVMMHQIRMSLTSTPQ